MGRTKKSKPGNGPGQPSTSGTMPRRPKKAPQASGSQPANPDLALLARHETPALRTELFRLARTVDSRARDGPDELCAMYGLARVGRNTGNGGQFIWLACRFCLQEENDSTAASPAVDGDAGIDGASTATAVAASRANTAQDPDAGTRHAYTAEPAFAGSGAVAAPCAKIPQLFGPVVSRDYIEDHLRAAHPDAWARFQAEGGENFFTHPPVADCPTTLRGWKLACRQVYMSEWLEVSVTVGAERAGPDAQAALEKDMEAVRLGKKKLRRILVKHQALLKEGGAGQQLEGAVKAEPVDTGAANADAVMI